MPDQQPTPLTCQTCGAPDFYKCGCYDRCRCDHDRRNHTAQGVCMHTDCDCRHGLHGHAGAPSVSPGGEDDPWLGVSEELNRVVVSLHDRIALRGK